MSVPTALALGLGVAACVSDLRSRTIPNWLTLAGCVCGLAWHGWTGGLAGAAWALAGAACGFAALLAVYLLGGAGGGDVKLLAAFGAMVGPVVMAQSLLWIGLAGGLAAAGVVLWRHSGRLLRRQAVNQDLSCRRLDFIPYAPAITAGVWLSMLAGA